MSDAIPSLDELKSLEAYQAQITQRIKTALDVDAKVTFVEPRSLRHIVDGKDRVVDRRQQ